MSLYDIHINTKTGEPYQIAKLNYRLYSKKNLMKILLGLNCIDKDVLTGRLVWLYDYETKGIKFEKSYSEIPLAARPIVLGSFYILPQLNVAFLNTNSFQRVVKALRFFEKIIPRSVAEVSDIEIVNKKLNYSDCHNDLHFEYFAERRNSIVNMIDEGEDDNGEFFPEIERITSNFYGHGIDKVEKMLMLRQRVALNKCHEDKKSSLDSESKGKNFKQFVGSRVRNDREGFWKNSLK